MTDRKSCLETAVDLGVSDRVSRVERSASLAIGDLAATLEREGADVIDLSLGDPDFETPQPIVAAAKRALDAGHTHYTQAAGIPTLREAIATTLQVDGLEYRPEDIIVTPGGKQALFETIQTLVDDGDEVILLDPAWVSYEPMVKLTGGSLTRIDLAPYEFRLEPALDELGAAMSDETRLLIVNSPNNPSGAVYTEAALQGVRDLVVDHDVLAIADELYDALTYEVEAPNLGALDGMSGRTVTINGFSKAYAMTGWRLGYLAAPASLVTQVTKIHSHSVTCAPTFVQHAGVEALANADAAVREMRERFRQRRDLLMDLLGDLGVDVPTPDGAFYLMLPVDENDVQWCETAVEEAHVAMVPGSAFGMPGYARISYVVEKPRLRTAIERLQDEGLLQPAINMRSE